MTLPTFLVIGTAKAGTTALYRYVGQHPDVYLSPLKEPRFFICDDGKCPTFTGPGDDGYQRGIVSDIDAYRALFRPEGESAVGEMSPTYLYWPTSAERIAETLGDVKIIAILRDPVERAFSNYLMHVRAGLEDLDFESALEAEERRIELGWNPSFHYEARGYYARQLRPYLERFDADRILLLFHDDLRARPLDLLQTIFRFLDVDPSVVPDLAERPNRSLVPRSVRVARLLSEPSALVSGAGRALPRSARQRLRRRLTEANLKRPELSRSVRARLVERYESDNTALERIAGRDLAPWRRR